MKTARTRIVNVRPKRGGKVELVVSDTTAQTEMLSKALLTNVKRQRDCMGADLAGWALVSWDFAGGYYEAYGVHQSSPIGETLMPTFVREALTRRRAQDDARNVMREFLRNE